MFGSARAEKRVNVGEIIQHRFVRKIAFLDRIIVYLSCRQENSSVRFNVLHRYFAGD